MNPQKLRILFILGFFVLVIIIILSISFGSRQNNSGNHKNDNVTNNYSYSFDETVDIDSIETDTETSSYGTDSPDYGVINEFYDNTDYFFDGRELHIQNIDGHDIVSEEWKEEGYGALIEKPEFGTLEKFILSPNQASARYNDVKMKDVESYIKSLKEQGFTNVVKDLKNNRANIYIYSAKKGEKTVTLNYEDESLLIEIF